MLASFEHNRGRIYEQRRRRRSGWSGFGRTTFPADLIIYHVQCSHAQSTYMQTRQWHLFLVLVVGLPLKLHSSQGLFFPKTAILMLRERFLIAENTCVNFFPRFARTDRRFAPLRYEWAVPLLLCRCRP